MSTLYAAELRPKYRHQGSPRQVVLKLANPDRVAFLKEEAEFLIRFRHPGIVRMYPLPTLGGDDFVGFAQTPNGRQPYIALEYAGGGSLEEYMARRGPLPVREAVSVASQVARALDHAHTCGVVNRDVKPGNILFRRRPSTLWAGRSKVVLCDFGIAQDLARPHAGESGVGTIAYMSPEQLQRLSHDWVRVEPWADIFALGVVLYEMLTGRTPFDGDVARIIDAAASPAPPSSLRSGIPPFLDRIVLQALEKDPHYRFQTARTLAEALDHVPRRINWRFVVVRAISLSLLVLAVMLAWQVGSMIQDGHAVDTPVATQTVAPMPTFDTATPQPATQMPSPPTAMVAPTVTLVPRPTSTPLKPTQLPSPPTSTVAPTVTLVPRPTSTPLKPTQLPSPEP